MTPTDLTLAADLLHVLRVLGTACVVLWSVDTWIAWRVYRMERERGQ